MGREVHFHFPPTRIVSLVPSQTEFLIDIGAPVTGRTKFCIHPQNSVTNIPIIGGTKKFQLDKIRKLNPDLIIGNKEENDKDGIAALEKILPVWMSDIASLDDAFTMMETIGSICNLTNASRTLVTECTQAVRKVKAAGSGQVIYLIWQNPWMAAGKNTFIDHLLTHLGYENAVTHGRYPKLTNEQIQSLDPDYIFFSSEPYPFKETHLKKAENQWPKAICRLVDGELYSWYGSRLRKWATALS